VIKANPRCLGAASTNNYEGPKVREWGGSTREKRRTVRCGVSVLSDWWGDLHLQDVACKVGKEIK
jgi:hypothetical protein